MNQELISPPTEFYLSYVPGRGHGNHQKIHSTLGHAKSALSSPAYSGTRQLHEEIDGIRTGRYMYDSKVRGGQIWKWAVDHWELLFDIPVGSWGYDVPWKKRKENYVP